MIRIVFNIEPVIARLGRVSQVLDDMTPVFQNIGEYVVEATKKRFTISTAPDGTKWQPKSAATIARYQARKDGNRPKPLIGPSGRLGREINKLATRDQVEIGSALEYSGVMQDGAAKGAFGTAANGSPIPWGRIPARVWLGLSDDDNRNILDIADEYLAEAAGD
ncbi:MAG: phage virion morphogenesis protein [Sphingomonas pseudosanguinis]|uniref:phage virion morphogenesis protein n=1 Tax=Sphingomonas pseudosanguinis TaxID=413712 RepID=UPI00391D454A